VVDVLFLFIGLFRPPPSRLTPELGFWSINFFFFSYWELIIAKCRDGCGFLYWLGCL